MTEQHSENPESLTEGEAYLAWVEDVLQPQPGEAGSGFALLDLLHPSEVSLIRSRRLSFASLVEREVDDGLKTLPLILPFDQMTAAWKAAIEQAQAGGQKLNVWIRRSGPDGGRRQSDGSDQGPIGRAVLALSGWNQDGGDDGDPVFVEDIAPALPGLSRQVDAALRTTSFAARAYGMSLSGAATSKRRADFLSSVLDHPTWRDPELAVGVYDVGQGNASALVDKHEHPRVFFDIGKPISVFAHTKPANAPDFFRCDSCIKARRQDWLHAPVVLSHWDFDHWAGVLSSVYVRVLSDGTKAARLTLMPHALERYWIVPNQDHLNLGPTHKELIRLLAKSINGGSGMPALQYWPSNVTQIRFTHGMVVKAKPDAGAGSTIAAKRNNSGLVLLLTFPSSRQIPDPPWVLLPGDARRESISIPLNIDVINLVGMVVSHHGGVLGSVPLASPWLGIKRPNPNVVCSVGRPNAAGAKPYGHPAAVALSAHASQGWDPITFTFNSLVPASSRHSLGNYCISLGKLQPRCSCSCVDRSNLSLNRIPGT